MAVLERTDLFSTTLELVDFVMRLRDRDENLTVGASMKDDDTDVLYFKYETGKPGTVYISRGGVIKNKTSNSFTPLDLLPSAEEF